VTSPSTPTPAPDASARRVFRANPAYDVVPFDRLTTRDQATIAEFARDPDFFGILRPRSDSTGTIKAVSRNVALLIYSLQTPGTIPRQAVAGGDGSIVDAVWRLTLDGVLEVERDGVFVSGADALADSATNASHGAVARLSHDALRLIARIEGEDPLALADRLYHFNRRPLTPKWVARISTAGDVLRFAGASTNSHTSSALARHWKTKATDVGEYWLSWWPRVTSRNPRRSADDQVTYKLYVSPKTEMLPDVFPAVVDVLVDAGAPPFKIGASASAILRPDKLVAYFTRRTAAEEVASAIASKVGETTAQPVPFTHELAGDGLVSLGIDPPSSRAMLSQVGSSWRQWVCRRLASYVATAQRAGRSRDADRFALERVTLDGIDPSTWEPSEDAVRGFAADTSA